MLAEFQRAMDYTLVGLKNMHFFLDDILIDSRGYLENQMNLVYNCLRKLDVNDLSISLAKFHFGKTEIERLRNRCTQSGISPLKIKTAAMWSLSPRTTLKKLRSFLDSVHLISKFIPSFASLCHPFKTLLKKKKNLIGHMNMTITLKKLNNKY